MQPSAQPERARTARPALLGLAALVVVLLVGLVLAVRTFGDLPSHAAARRPAANAAAEEAASSSPAAPSAAARPPAITVEALERALRDYEAVAEFPHTSRPHDEGTAYKLSWNTPIPSEIPAAGQPGLTIRFDADRAHVGPGQPLTSWIEVVHSADFGRRVPFQVKSAWVMSLSGSNVGRVTELVYRDDGRDGDTAAGDRRLTNRFVPVDEEILQTAREVRILALLDIGGVENQVFRDFTYAPAPVLEVLSVSDRQEDGSLVVTLEVDVRRAGTISFEANVYDGAGEEPIGYVDAGSTLEVGRATVELVFYGKMFRDRSLGGPFVVADFRGFLLDPSTGVPVVWMDARRHVTAAYPTNVFRSQPWDSAEKQEKIESLRQLIANGGQGDPDAPRHIVIEADGTHTVMP